MSMKNDISRGGSMEFRCSIDRKVVAAVDIFCTLTDGSARSAVIEAALREYLAKHGKDSGLPLEKLLD